VTDDTWRTNCTPHGCQAEMLVVAARLMEAQGHPLKLRNIAAVSRVI
jgi:hypothetical protein